MSAHVLPDSFAVSGESYAFDQYFLITYLFPVEHIITKSHNETDEICTDTPDTQCECYRILIETCERESRRSATAERIHVHITPAGLRQVERIREAGEVSAEALSGERRATRSNCTTS